MNAADLKPGIIVRDQAGEFHAFSAICTHLGCTVQYRPDNADIWCACHNGHYDVTGRNVSGPRSAMTSIGRQPSK